ncbi:hypothetical protein ACSBR1_025792 [Camellia fascicularis]
MSIRNRLSSEYREGVKSFLQFAMKNVGLDNRIRCGISFAPKRDVAFIQDLGAPWQIVLVNQPRVWNNDNEVEGVVDEGTTNECLDLEDELYDMLEDCHMANIFDDDEEDEWHDN